MKVDSKNNKKSSYITIYPFQNLKYIINIYNPYVFLYTTNSYRNMSSRKEDKERKEKITSNRPSQDIASTDSATTTATTTTTTEDSLYAEQQQQQQQQEQQHAVNRALDNTRDNTRDNIRRSIDEARSQIPRYTQSVNDYQEQTIQASREIADNYLELQKEIINSFQSAWVPFAENTYKMNYEWWISPRKITQIYANMVSSIADNTIAATRLANSMVFANMEVFKNSMQQAKDNVKELSRINVNAIRCTGHISGDNTATATATATASRFYGVREHFGGDEEEQQQIPSRQNEQETQRVIEAQDHISGERKEQTIRDLPGIAAVGQALKGLRFPADKNKIVQFVQQQSNTTNPDCQKIVPLLQRIENRQYQNVSDVTKTAGLVE
jgi:hypothetical protein